MRSQGSLILLGVAVSLGVLPPLVSRAQVPPQTAPTQTPATGGGDITITLQGLEARLLPIAIPALRGAGGDQVAEVVSRDLRLSSLFRVLDARSFTANLDAEGLTIDPRSWTPVGATAVVKGQATGSGDSLRVELRVWEPGRPGEPVLSRTYGPLSARQIGHRIANDLIQLYTRTAGVFGTRIAFARRGARNRKEIFTVDCDGENLAQVSRGRRINLLPAWGPGGLYFSSQTPEGFFALFRQGRSEPVLQADGLVMGAAFSGSRMAIVLTRDGNSEIYVGSHDGSGLRRLTNDPGADVSPVFSPDGSKIAFVSDRAGGPQVYVMDSGGGGQRRVSFTGSYNTSPTWAPDNQTIAYAGRSGGSDIFSVNIGGGSPRRLTEGQGSNTDPTFSPDGRMIAFSSSRGGIYLMNQDGLNQQRILAGTGETLRWEPR